MYPTPLEQLLEVAVNRQKVTIGLPAPTGDCDRRFPLTPEAAGMLVARGFVVKMEAGGADAIHYSDLRYQQHGVDIVERVEAFRCDLVIYLSALTGISARMLKRGAVLLTMRDSVTADVMAMRQLIANNVITLALDLYEDEASHHPFDDILSEISGRASISIASSLLADSLHGKGILLGGIAGIVPCEVTIIGSGIDACAAASSAIGLGALVRMFDNDIYRLRSAMRQLGPGVSGSALHPRVLVNALRSADVVVATEVSPKHQISGEVVREMKQGVVVFDLDYSDGATFPSLQCVDLGKVSAAESYVDGMRLCYINPANSVARTVAMALSNTFLSAITTLFTCDGLSNALMLHTGLQKAAMTFLGKAVHPEVAKSLGLRHVDIKLLLQFS